MRLILIVTVIFVNKIIPDFTYTLHYINAQASKVEINNNGFGVFDRNVQSSIAQ